MDVRASRGLPKRIIRGWLFFHWPGFNVTSMRLRKLSGEREHSVVGFLSENVAKPAAAAGREAWWECSSPVRETNSPVVCALSMLGAYQAMHSSLLVAI